MEGDEEATKERRRNSDNSVQSHIGSVVSRNPHVTSNSLTPLARPLPAPGAPVDDIRPWNLHSSFSTSEGDVRETSRRFERPLGSLQDFRKTFGSDV